MAGSTSSSEMILLDCGKFMQSKIENKTKFERAKTLVQLYIQQKILLSPKDEIALLLFGCNETNNEMNEERGNFENISVMFELGPPSAQLLKDIQALELSPETSADCFDAIVVATDYLEKTVSKKKKLKKIFIFTAGESGEISETRQQLDGVAECLKDLEHQLLVVWVGDEKGNALETKEFLTRFCGKAGGILLEHDIAMRNLKEQKHKSVQQTTKTRLNLTLLNTIEIPVWCYLKIKEEGFLPLKSMSTTKGGAVRMNRSYVRQRNGITNNNDGFTDGDEVPFQERTRAYLYGKDLIPITETEIQFLKFDGGEKCLKVFGTLPKEEIPQYLLTEKTEVIAADPNYPSARAGLADMIDALCSLKYVMLARYVWRKPYSPKLTVLTPSKKRGCLYLNYLPFAEDIRELAFRSLPNVTLKQKEVMMEFIDKLTLMRPSTFEEKQGESPVKELFKPNRTYNPSIQKFYRFVMAKALRADATIDDIESNALDGQIDVDISVRGDLESSNILEKLKEQFELEPIASETRSRKRFWREAFDNKEQTLRRPKVSLQSLNVENEDVNVAETSHISVDNDRESRLKRVNEMKIGCIHPIKDFQEMMDVRDVDLTLNAFEQLEAVIQRFVVEGGKIYFGKALECIKVMRASGISENAAEKFNSSLHSLRNLCLSDSAYESMWKSIQISEISLITSNESKDSKVSYKEAQEFLQGSVVLEATEPSLPATTQQVRIPGIEEDDLLDLIQ